MVMQHHRCFKIVNWVIFLLVKIEHACIMYTNGESEQLYQYVESSPTDKFSFYIFAFYPNISAEISIVIITQTHVDKNVIIKNKSGDS